MRRPAPAPLSSPVRAEIAPGLWLDSRLALWIAAERLLVIADPHWGYAASHRARGNLVPLWGDEELERRLRALIADYAPVEMLWLGDTVHAAEGAAQVERFLREPPVPVTLIAGNHDRRWAARGVPTLSRGRYFFHHGDRDFAGPAGALEIVGHHHPAVAWSDGAGTSVKVPALIASPTRLVLPAFSPWAAGTPWGPRRSNVEIIWAVAPTRIFALPSSVSSQSVTSAS